MSLDLVTLRSELTATGELGEVGGPAYIAALVDGVPRSQNVEHYADLMREIRERRDLIFYANKVLGAAYDGADTARGIRQQADEWLFESADLGRADNEMVPQKRAFAEFVDELDRRIQRKDELLGFSTGMPALDDFTAGMVPDEVTVLAAGTGGGKSALALNIALAIARAGALVMCFSLEMTYQELQFRLASILSGVPAFKIRKGWLNDSEMSRIAVAMNHIAEIPLWYDQTLEVTIRDIRSQIRKKKREAALSGIKLGLVVIDYFQLLTPVDHGKRRDTRRDAEFAEMSRGIKKLAREFDVPVLLLSQLSRGDKRERSRRPVLSDLKETSALEQDASNVWFLYYDNEHDGKVSLIVAKARSGPTGDVELVFEKDILRFHDPKAQGPLLEPVQAPIRDS